MEKEAGKVNCKDKRDQCFEWRQWRRWHYSWPRSRAISIDHHKEYWSARLNYGSGASFHVTPNTNWFTTYDATQRGHVQFNSCACKIVRVGDVHIKSQNGSSFTLKKDKHAPNLIKSLISIDQQEDADRAAHLTTTF